MFRKEVRTFPASVGEIFEHKSEKFSIFCLIFPAYVREDILLILISIFYHLSRFLWKLWSFAGRSLPESIRAAFQRRSEKFPSFYLGSFLTSFQEAFKLPSKNISKFTLKSFLATIWEAFMFLSDEHFSVFVWKTFQLLLRSLTASDKNFTAYFFWSKALQLLFEKLPSYWKWTF